MPKEMEIKEQYLVSVYDLLTQETMYTLVPSNREFSCLMDGINPERYMILTITPLTNVIAFKELIKKLLNDNKPDNLNFGNDIEGNK